MTKTPIAIALAKKGQLASMLQHVDYPNFNDEVPCAGKDTEMFFSERPSQISKAKSMCAECPMMQQCAAWAVRYEDYGVFGGLSAKERQLMRGGEPVLNTDDVTNLRAEIKYIFDASAKEVAMRFGVQSRTVVRWRNILRPLGMVG